MKFLKKFTDWKAWLFIILPIVMIITEFAIGIYIYVNTVHNVSLVIVALILFPAACLLIFMNPRDFQIKKKHIWRSVASTFLFVCFLVLQIIVIVMTPNLVSTSWEEQQLYQALHETSSDDEKYEGLFRDWSSEHEKLNSARSAWQFVFYGSLWALVFSSICAPKTGRDSNEIEDNSKAKQE